MYSVQYLYFFSDTRDKLLEDYEVQNWAKELSLDVQKGGCGIQVRAFT